MDANLPTLAELNRKEELRFWVAFAFVLWPLGPVLIPLFVLCRWLVARRRIRLWSTMLGLYRAWLAHPFYLLRLARARRNGRLVVAILLLLPLCLTTVLGLYAPGLGAHETPAACEALRSPLQHAPMGTDSLGNPLLPQITRGSRHSYLCGLLAVMVALLAGLALGAATDRRMLDGPTMVGLQLIETIPLVILMMIAMALFSQWSGAMPAARRELLRILLLGLGLGLGLAPPVARLVRGRIQVFRSQDFVSAAKAHGVSHRQILWRHILLKNTATDLLIVGAQTWGSAMLIEISIGYVFSIGAPKLGGEPYASWAWLLLAPESKDALIGNVPSLQAHWWLWFFPAFFTVATICGFYLFGDGLRCWSRRRDRFGVDGRESRFEAAVARHLTWAKPS